MTFVTSEGSVESSTPREGIEILVGLVMHRIATGTRDVVINGNTFTAYPSQREEVKITTTEDGGSELRIHLPLVHPAVRRYLANGVPPKRISVTVWRKQAGGFEEIIHEGFVVDMQPSGSVAVFVVPSALLVSMQQRLPKVLVGRNCPHILYDQNCQVVEASFRVSTTVVSVDGRKVVVASMGAHSDGWANGGRLVHVSSGEPMMVLSHLSVTITMQLPIYELRAGDAVTVSAGCPHDVETCHTKFNNRVNFAGQPHLNSVQIFRPNGFGIYVAGDT